MRTSEWVQAGFTVILSLVAWARPLSAGRRSAIALFAASTVVLVVLARLSGHLLSSDQSAALRDWLPVALMLVPYWQTGMFFSGPDKKVQARLAAIDLALERWLPGRWRWGRATRLWMEWAYMLCYPLVPLGLAVLYWAGQRQSASTYWLLVLVPTYLCYAITPFVPALPPRSFRPERETRRSSTGRVMNLWILKHGSIQAISFPSAHVASSLAVSLVLLRTVPHAGVIFLIITFWISAGAIVGGYHYAIDVVLGALTTLAVFAVYSLGGYLIPSALMIAPLMARATGL